MPFEAGNKIFIRSTFEDDVGNYIFASAVLNSEQGTAWKKRQNPLFLHLFKYLNLLPKMLYLSLRNLIISLLTGYMPIYEGLP